MKMISSTLWFILIFCAALPAQIDCNKFLEQGQKAASQEDFELAMNSFNSALRCGDKEMGALVDQEVTKLFNVINKKQAQAEAQMKTAQVVRDSFANLLKKFEESGIEIVDVLMAEANDLIYHLDYTAATAKLHTAASFNQPTASFKKTVAEVAFFWNEAGLTKQATDLLMAVRQTGIPSEQTTLHRWLKEYAGAWYDSLMQRYYPIMLPVPGGESIIGNRKALLSAFKIARTEMTIWQYAIYFTSQHTDNDLTSLSWGINGDNPMVYVSWNDAARYANWLSKQFSLDTVYIFERGDVKQINYSVNGYRLPTEVEWEYAARGGPAQDTFEYAGSNTIDSVGWYYHNSDNRTHPVAMKKANGLGLYDMSGNVAEWCGDWYGYYYEFHEPATFPPNYRGPDKGLFRVGRGGSWNGNAGGCRPTSRGDYAPAQRYISIGLRLVLQS